jgi:hypothetical protein
MEALNQILQILTKPDNIPIAVMLLLVIFFSWVGIRQGRINDRLIEEKREDEITKVMQR